MRGVERELHILGRGTGDGADHLAVDGGDVVEVLALYGWHPFAADPIVVVGTDRDFLGDVAENLVDHLVFLLCRSPPRCAGVAAFAIFDRR
jgi:hypothetical protein